MVKKIYNGLILFFFIAILVFYGNNLSIKEYDEITNEYFNSTIYLKTMINQKETLEHLKEMANEYSVTIAKVIPNDNNGTDVFVYSPGNKYTDDFLSSYKLDKGLKEDKLNIHTKVIQTFYNKEITIRPLEDLENVGVEGRYSLNIRNNLNLEILAENVNNKYSNELTVLTNQRMKNTFTAGVESVRYNYGLVLISILFITLLTSFLYDIKGRKKEIAIKRLLGYDTKDIFYDIFRKKALLPIILSVLLSELLIISFFIFNGNIKNLNILKYFLFGSIKLSLLFAIVFIAIFALILFINLANRFQRIKIVSYINGEENSRNILSPIVKMGSTLTIIVIFGVLSVSWNFVFDKKDAVNEWTNTKEYASLNIYIPQDISKDKKRQAEFEQTHKLIWNYLDNKNGIMFYKSTDKINESPILINNREVDVSFIYINDNYLRKHKIFDISDNRINPFDKDNKNKITVLVPLSYKPYEDELKEIIHKKHVFDKYISEDVHKEWITGEKNLIDLSKENLNNPNITEEIIYIKDNQSLFTYSAGGDFVTNGILAIVDGENMGANVYTPSLSEGIRVKYDDINELNKETRKLFNDLGYGEVDTDFTSVYQQNSEDIQYFKNMIGFSIIVLILSLLFLIFSLLFYLEVYFLNNRRRISIKNFLGYGFFIRNKNAFISLFLQDTVIVIISIIIGVFITNKIVGIKILYPILMISLLVLLFDMICTSVILKSRESKVMVKTLKGD